MNITGQFVKRRLGESDLLKITAIFNNFFHSSLIVKLFSKSELQYQ